MQIAIIPDEYTYDPLTGFELGRKWGIEHYEIRYAHRWRVPNGPGWVADNVAGAAKAYGITVTAISPGLFKPMMRIDGSQIPISMDTPDEIRRHLDELLPQHFEFADRLGTKKVTVFSLAKPADAPTEPIPSLVIDTLAEAADKAAANGFTLLLENGGGMWADSGQATASLVKAVGSDALKVTWDPANVVYGKLDEDPVADGYPAVAPYLGNVHVKDARVTDGQSAWVPFGDGVVDWSTQFSALRKDGYQGFLTLEPHLQYQPGMTHLVDKLETFVARVRGLLDA